MSKQRAQCRKCHAPTTIDELADPADALCDPCWEDEQTNMDPNDPDYYDYMSFSDADEGL